MTDKVGDKLSSLIEEFRNLIDINKSRKMRHLKARHFTKAEFETIDQLLSEIENLIDNLDSKSNITEQTNEDIENPPYSMNEKEMIHIDQTLLNLGMSKNGGYSKKQREALGLNPAWPPVLGDIENLIGSRISKEKRDLFLSLKNMHLKVKKKKENVSKDSKKKRRKSKRKYSKKFQEEAINLIKEGYSASEVSTILGVNKETVRNWTKRRGIPTRSNKYPVSLQNDVLDLAREGKSNTEISKLTGVSTTTVVNWKKEFQKEGF